MVTHAQVVTPIRARYNPGIAISREAEKEETAVLSALAKLQLTHALQEELRVEQVLQRFLREVSDVLPDISMTYRAAEGVLSFAGGLEHQHRCHYHLDILGHSLGDLTFSRKQAFDDAEQVLLEVMLCRLVYPLRNAMVYERAVQSATHDPLTGLQGRQSFDQHLRHEMAVAARHGTPLTVMFVAVDFFRNLKDPFGTLIADYVLCDLTEIIKSCTRKIDFVFRYHGDQFAIILPKTDERGARPLATRICAALTLAGSEVAEHRVPVTVSIGMAAFQTLDNAATLTNRAERCCHQAKVSGESRIVDSDS